MMLRSSSVLFFPAVFGLLVAGLFASAADAKPNREGVDSRAVDNRTGSPVSARDRELRNLEQAVQSLGGTVRHATILQSAGKEFDIDPLFLASLAHVESHFKPMACSKKGARGLMQLRSVVTNVLGVVNPWDPYENIMAGAAYLRTCFNRYSDHENSTYLALAAYNIGPGPVEKLTKSDAAERFVKKVLVVYNSLTDVPIYPVGKEPKQPLRGKLPAFAEFFEY